MSNDRRPLYHRHRFPPEVISYAVWLYFRFPLSLRMVEEMLAARSICVTYETVCREPSWLENIELRAKKPSNVRISTKDILTFDGLASPLELQAGLSRIGVRTLFAPVGSSHPEQR
jgi:hypothetical protein